MAFIDSTPAERWHNVLSRLARPSPRKLLLACSWIVTGSADAQRVTNANGARVIAYDASARPRARWTVGTSPLVRIGGTNGTGPTEFAEILGIARMRDGRIVVADGGSTELRVFSPSGEFIRAIGRKGRGPGEFDGIQFMLRSADTVVVHDRTTRLQIYTADGTLLRSYARPLFPGRSVSSWPGVLSDGSGVVQGVDPTPEFTGDQATQTASLGIKPPVGTEARLFTQIPVFERVRKNGQSVGLFLGAVSRVAVMGARVCSGYTIKWEIQCFDRSGKLTTRTTRDTKPGNVTSTDIDEFKKGYAAANKTQPPDRLKTALDMLQFAEQRSAFGRFVPSPTGELWVGEFVVLESFIPGRRGTVIPPRPTTWSVIGTDGTWVADVVLPARFSLLDAGRDYVAGIELDADDVESVVVYPLKR